MTDSTQQRVSRNRPPRVQITYDVETGGAQRKREIPFVVGVLAPLSGDSKSRVRNLTDKKFVSIDRDNFDKVLASLNPLLEFNVPNTLEGSGSVLNISLAPSALDDIDPRNVVLQVPELAELYRQRSLLRDVIAKADSNDKLMSAIEHILTDKDKQKSVLKVLEGAAEAISEARSQPDEQALYDAIIAAIPEASRSGSSELGTILHSTKMVLDPDQTAYSIVLINELLTEFVVRASEAIDGGTTPNVQALVNGAIAAKDAAISRQLNYVLHHPKFQALEASWRGLHYLVSNTETSSRLKVRVLDATFDELYRDLDKAVDFDQSGLFNLVYEEEYGTFGGEPYSLLIGDYEIGRSARDLIFIERISNVAAAAHAPFISSAGARLFDLDDFDALNKPTDLSKIFESAELAKWRGFRDSEDSRYVTLTLPKVLLRLPFHHRDNPVDGLYFDEDVATTVMQTDDEGNVVTDKAGNPVPCTFENPLGVESEQTLKEVDAKKMLWGNPAYVLGRVITKAFALHGWTAAIRGVEGGGLVEGLPSYTFESESGDIALSCPTQIAITDRREKELNDLGFMAISHCKGSDKAAFFGGQTTNKAKQYLNDAANKNAEISSMLPYMLAASRFAHYIKVMMREQVGTFMSRQSVQDYLNNWIVQYVLLDDGAPQALKAKYPLREARVEVVEVEGRVGAYKATVFLRPHFQLEELTASIRLVADLPS